MREPGKKTTPNTWSWDFEKTEHWQHLLEDFYKAEHALLWCSLRNPSTPCDKADVLQNRCCTSSVSRMHQHHFPSFKHSSCGEPHVLHQHLLLGEGCDHILPVSTATSHLHSTIPSGKILIFPANHSLQEQELCLGEVYSSAGLTAFTSFLYPGQHTNPDRNFQAEAVHTIFKQPYLDNLFLLKTFFPWKFLSLSVEKNK